MTLLTCHIFGPFRLIAPDGSDVTPTGKKEKAICALTLLAPEQKRARSWLRERLWDNPDPKQAQSSMRTALKNVRQTLGDFAPVSDKTHLWFSPKARIDTSAPKGVEFLEDLDIDNPLFDDWRRELAQYYDGETAPTAPTAPTAQQGDRPVIFLHIHNPIETEQTEFWSMALASEIGEKFRTMGDIHVQFEKFDPSLADGNRAFQIDLRLMQESTELVAFARVLGPPRNSFICSDRLHVRTGRADVSLDERIGKFANKLMTSILNRASHAAGRNTYFSMQNAARKLFTGDMDDVVAARQPLLDATVGDQSGIAHAWLSYLHLTQALEFRHSMEEQSAQAQEHVRQALQQAPYSPVTAAISSQVLLKLTGDLDFSRHLALRAFDLAEGDAYALDAMSQVMTFSNDPELAHDYALRAHSSSRGMVNEFSWDLLACMTALGIDDFNTAYDHALACHMKMPHFRPALRYIIGLNLLLNRVDEAARFAAKLRHLEPDFSPALLGSDDYPMATFRHFGLTDEIKPTLPELSERLSRVG